MAQWRVRTNNKMAMTKQQLKDFYELCELAETYSDRVNDWEANFLTSVKERVDKYGEDTQMSEKQLETIEKISRKVYVV